MAENVFDVIVVGAGISGLTAAFNIKSNYPAARIIVLEGKDRVGGRTLTVSLASSEGTDHWDLGGQWVGRSQIHIIRLLHRLGIATYSQFNRGTKLQQIAEVNVRKYTSEIPNLSLFALLDLHFFLAKLDRLQAELSIEDPYSHPQAAEWDAMSLAAYLNKTLYTKAARRANDAAIRCILGCEASQISFLYYLLYVRMAGGIKNIINSAENSAQEWKIQGGAQQISERLADRFGQDTVRLGDPVASIQQTETSVIISTAAGWTGSASFVILAMPPKAIEHISFSPRLSEDRIDFMKHMPMGNMIKVIITYKTFFWRDENLSGEVVSDGGEVTVPGCSLGPLSITYDATTYNGCPAIVAFLGGDAAVSWARQTARVRQEGVLNHLAVFFGEDVHNYIQYIEKNWNDEPYSWGAPVSFVAPGGVENFARAIRRPEGRIHFAGTETATTWSGYMSGAVQAGERSALEVLFRLKPSFLSAADASRIEHAMAQYEKNNLVERQIRQNNGWTRVITTVISCSLGLGLVTVGSYLFIRYIIKGEVSFGWSKSAAGAYKYQLLIK